MNFNFLKKQNLKDLIEIDPHFIKNIILEFNKLSDMNKRDFESRAFDKTNNSSIFYLGVEKEIKNKQAYIIKKNEIEEFVKNNYPTETVINKRVDFYKRRICDIKTSRLIGVVIRLKRFDNNETKIICLNFPIEFIRTKK